MKAFLRQSREPRVDVVWTGVESRDSLVVELKCGMSTFADWRRATITFHFPLSFFPEH